MANENEVQFCARKTEVKNQPIKLVGDKKTADMFTTRKQVDEHVKKILAKVPSGKERDLRGLIIGRLYIKVHEYNKAIEFLNAFLAARDDAAAHKLIAFCYKERANPDFQKAIDHYQRSIQLNPKQNDIIKDALELLHNNRSVFTKERANYWMDLALKGNIMQDTDLMLSLRLNIAGNDKDLKNSMEMIIQKELLSRPNDMLLRVRLLQNYLENKRIDDAFNYAYNTEVAKPGQCQLCEWYDIIWTVLQKCEQSNKETIKNWPYWQLLFITLERLIEISLQSESSSSLGDSIAQLFKLDQYVYKFSLLAESLKINGGNELHQCCQEHYTSQVVLHAASVLFKRELMAKKNRWSNTVRNALPLLLLGYQNNILKDTSPIWQRHLNTQQKNLIDLWRNQAAFRSAQLGRTLYGCLQQISIGGSAADILNNWQQQDQAEGLWANSDALLATVRQHCADNQWRSQLYQQLYTQHDHKLKDQTSQLMRDTRLQQPLYEWPTVAEIEEYEQQALMLVPPTLERHVYLALGTDNLAEAPRVKFYTSLQRDSRNFLSRSAIDSLSQLDVDVFLYAVVLQAQRKLQIQRENYNSYHVGNRNATTRPHMLPFANIMNSDGLITTEQSQWWSLVQRFQDNLNMAQYRDQLQIGLEAVRGLKPKADIIVILRLGKLLASREDSSDLESRIETFYKLGINMLRRHQQHKLEPFYRYFKYANSEESNVWLQTQQLAEDAVAYLSKRAFKQHSYLDLISELRGLQLPMAFYMQAEAYRQLADNSQTTRVARQNFQERRLEYLRNTKDLLTNQSDHPLNTVVQRELNSSLPEEIYGSPEMHNNSSTYEDAEDDFYTNAANSLNRSHNRSRRQMELHATTPTNTAQLEQKMSKQLCGLKDHLDSAMETMRHEMQERFDAMEELLKTLKIGTLYKENDTPTRDEDSAAAAALGLDEFLNMEEAMQSNFLNGVQQPTAHNAADRYFTAPNPAASLPNPPDRYYTPNNLAAPLPNAAQYGSPMFNQNPMYNYFANQAQFMRGTPPAPGPAGMPPNFFTPRAPGNFGMSPNLYGTPAGAPFMDNLNYGLTGTPHSLVIPQASQAPLTLTQSASNMPIASTGGFFNSAQFAPSPSMPLLSAVVSQQVPQQMPPPPAMAQQMPQVTQTAPQQQQQKPKTADVVLPAQGAPVPAAVAPSPAPAAAAAPAVAPVSAAVVPVPITAPASTAIPAVFNRALNNQPVEKEPPANVVITSSDPLPKPAMSSSQPTLSVTIPAQHIKPSLVSNSEPPQLPTMSSSDFNFSLGSNSNIFGGSGVFSFKTQVAQAAAEKQKELELEAAAAAAAAQNESTGSEQQLQNQSANAADTSAELDYDPRPDFKGIIPLPDEVEVRTGEEDEQIKFSYRAKLFRLVDKEWKERGIGLIKILTNQTTGDTRVIMRRDQTHKICANHKLTAGMTISTPQLDKDEKSLLWVANDFADEQLTLETFLVRFKLAETAKEFKLAFEEAVKTAASSTNEASKPKPVTFGNAAAKSFVTSTPAATNPPAATKQGEPTKTDGMATLAAKPDAAVVSKTLFGSNLTTDSLSTTTITKSASPFANFNFGMTSTSNLSFGSVSAVADSSANAYTTAFNFGSSGFGKPASDTSTLQQQPISLNQTEAAEPAEADADEEYVPTAQFAPVIPLPELIEVRTGEENEVVLFEHRAKLLRFDKSTSEWKERGLGNMKLLQLKTDPSQVRLLMRREQIFKLCCNQRLLPDTKFSYAKNSQNSLTWAGQDYAEQELTTELLCIRFKTADTCKEFYDAVLKAQAAMTTDQSNQQQKEPEKAKEVKQPAQGFGDAFKPKTGSWNCTGCYTQNEATTLKCLACETPKDGTVPDTKASETAGKFNFNFEPTKVGGFIFGAPGTKDLPKPSGKPMGFGDAFKPKTGSWNCTGCYTQNDPTAVKCLACETPKDGEVPEKSSSLDQSGALNLSSSAGKFNFGFNQAKPAVTSSFTFGSNKTEAPPIAFENVVKFNSAGAKTQAPKPPTSGFGDAFKPKVGSWSCQGCYTSNDAAQLYCMACEAPKDDTVPKKETVGTGLTLPSTAGKFKFGFNQAPSVPTTVAPSGLESEKFVFNPAGGNGLGSNTFSFSMQMPQQQPVQIKAPAADVSNDDDNHVDEEESTAYFAPVIPLPDKIEVKTGEEDEELLYVQRGKLYRLAENYEWKERGLGNVKILRHKQTKTLRVVMRREKVLKICLNHVLNFNVTYKPKDDKSWLFAVHDFSEGESVLERFALRFKNAEIAQGFENAVKNALYGTADPIQEEENTQPQQEEAAQQAQQQNQKPTNDVSDVSEVLKVLAEKLMVSYEFLVAESKCCGCRGCEPDNFDYGQPAKVDPEIQPLMPMELPELTIPKSTSKTMLKASILPSNSPKTTTSITTTSSGGFGGFSTAVSASSTATAAPNKQNAGFAFGQIDKPVFGQGPSLFGGITASKLQSSAANNASSKPQQQSIFGGVTAADNTIAKLQQQSIFGGAATDNSSSAKPPSQSIFSGVAAAENASSAKPPSQTIFSGVAAAENASSAKPQQQSIFGDVPAAGVKTASRESISGSGCLVKPVDEAPKSVFGSFAMDNSFTKSLTSRGSSSSGFIYGSNSGSTGTTPAFGSFNKDNKATTVEELAGSKEIVKDNKENIATQPTAGDPAATAEPQVNNNNLFSDWASKSGDDFASLAAKNGANPIGFQKSETGGFFGLSPDGRSLKSNNTALVTPASAAASTPASVTSTGDTSTENATDENYDPHYEAIIALPNEIVVSTGEEDEEKLFGERATLYRYDSDSKEWKERGVGELKILKHRTLNTYRMVMRREQILKLVLNMKVGAQFAIENMSGQTKSFVWGNFNYAESAEGVVERLAARFKKQDFADNFIKTMKKCIEDAKTNGTAANPQ